MVTVTPLYHTTLLLIIFMQQRTTKCFISSIYRKKLRGVAKAELELCVSCNIALEVMCVCVCFVLVFSVLLKQSTNLLYISYSILWLRTRLH